MRIVVLTEDTHEEAARIAAEALAEGGIVIYPTDTIYGIGVNALDPDALNRLRKLKVREQKKPMSILVPSIEHIERYGVMTPEARSLAEKFLPGGLTLVLPATGDAPRDVQLNDAIGVRIPADPFCRALTEAFDGPITSTSANRAGLVPPKDIQGILEHFGPDIEHLSVIIDGGPRNDGLSSTVVSFVHGDTPKVLREGVISRDDLGL